MHTQTKFFLIQSYPHIKGVSMKKNFNTIKAAIIMGIMIIFCIVSVLFFNKQTSSTPPVLATQSQPQEETTKAKKGISPVQFYNNFGGNNDDYLLDSKIINENIYLLSKSNSQDKHLSKNTQTNCIYLQKLSLNCDLIETRIILSYQNLYNAKIINDNIIIVFKQNNENYKYEYNIHSAISKTTKILQNINNCLFFENNIITTEKLESTQNIYLNSVLITTVSANHTISNIFKYCNNTYICFKNINSIEIFSINEKSIKLCFENSTIISTQTIEDFLFISLYTENKVIILKLNLNFEIVFSCEVNDTIFDSVQIIKITNGYNVYCYKTEKQLIFSYFLCQHGDLISSSQHTLKDIKNIINLEIKENQLLLHATTKADNFILETLTFSFETKKQVVLNTNTTCINYLILNDKDATYICLTTTANNLEFSDNFGKSDVFVFKTDYIL